MRVCRAMFVQTLQTSPARITTALKKFKSEEGVIDKRGLNASKNKCKMEDAEFVIKHIKSIPKYKSHYRRADTDSDFIPPDLTLQKLYDLYVEQLENSTCSKVSLSTFKKIFYTEFNLRTVPLKKDTYATNVIHLPLNLKIQRLKTKRI